MDNANPLLEKKSKQSLITMKAVLYFFGGTSNSYWLANKIKEKLSANMVPIAYVIYDDAVYQADIKFSINKNCKGCGICELVCSVNNIVLTGGIPIWLNHCENCLACYNMCSQKAIYGPLVETGFYYMHPAITVRDFINQKTA